MPPQLVIVVLNFPVPEDERVWDEAIAARDAAFDVTVVCPAARGHSPGVEVVDGVTVHYLSVPEGTTALGSIREAVTATVRARRAVAELALGQGDVLQVCNPPDSCAPLLRRVRRRGVATVYDQHDVVPLLAAMKRAHRPFVPLYRAQERRTVTAADAIITAGETQAARLRDLHGVSPEVVRTGAADTDMRHSPAERASVLGYVGVLGTQDGVDSLVAAAALLRGHGRDFTVRIAGDGPERRTLERLVEQLGLGETVEFAGWLGPHELERFMAGLDGCVVPDPVSEFNHSCPMRKVTHALAIGLPVVLTPLTENLLLTGGHGFISDGSDPHQLAAAIELWLDSSRDDRAAQSVALRAQFDRLLRWPEHRGRYVEVLRRAQAAVSPPPSSR